MKPGITAQWSDDEEDQLFEMRTKAKNSLISLPTKLKEEPNLLIQKNFLGWAQTSGNCRASTGETTRDVPVSR